MERERLRLIDDPEAFCTEYLGFEPWSAQGSILKALRDHRHVAGRSGHKVGKSRIAAAAAYWWVGTRRGARVVLTSSTSRQVKLILWREVKHLYHTSPRQVGAEFHEDPATGLRFPDGREIIGFTTDEPEKMGGFSGPAMLFIVDEASGFPEPLFEVIEGNLAGGGSILLLGNPTRTSGLFYDAFHTKRTFWNTLHISSEETPNAVSGKIIIPGLATRDWIEERKQEWGEDSPLYEVRVRGDFPSQAENAIITLALVEQARDRWADTKPTGDLRIGCDVARYGDDETVFAPVRGLYAFDPIVMRSMNGTQIAGRLLETVRRFRVGAERVLVSIDVIGYGASVVDAFTEMTRDDEGISVAAVNVQERARDEEHFDSRRSEQWFAGRSWLRDGGTLPDDPKLEAELVAPTYEIDGRGRIRVESKDKVKERIHRSPDRADAFLLAVGGGTSDVAFWIEYLHRVGGPVPKAANEPIPARDAGTRCECGGINCTNPWHTQLEEDDEA